MTATAKRDRIFDATVALLLEEGLLAVQTRAVTERAGVGTGLLNHYFRWPELRAAAWAAIFISVANDMYRESESPTEAIDRFFAESFAAQARHFWRLWIEAEGLALQDTAMAKAVTSARSQLRTELANILTDGASRSHWTLRAPRATAVRLEAMRDGLVGLLLVEDADLDASTAEAHLRDLFQRETEQGS